MTLWLEALDACPSTGEFESCIADDIASMAEWDGDGGPKVFCDALVRSGLLETTDGGFRIHDWHAYTVYLRKNIRDAERKRAARRRRVEQLTSADTSADSPRSVHVASADSPRSVRGKSSCNLNLNMNMNQREEESVKTHASADIPRTPSAERKRSTPPPSAKKTKTERKLDGLDGRLLKHYRERSGRRVRALSDRAQRAIVNLTGKGVSEQDLRDAVDGMLDKPHRGDDGREYREPHHAWSDALFEAHRARGEELRMGASPTAESWEAMKARLLAKGEAEEIDAPW